MKNVNNSALHAASLLENLRTFSAVFSRATFLCEFLATSCTVPYHRHLPTNTLHIVPYHRYEDGRMVGCRFFYLNCMQCFVNK